MKSRQIKTCLENLHLRLVKVSCERFGPFHLKDIPPSGFKELDIPSSLLKLFHQGLNGKKIKPKVALNRQKDVKDNCPVEVYDREDSESFVAEYEESGQPIASETDTEDIQNEMRLMKLLNLKLKLAQEDVVKERYLE